MDRYRFNSTFKLRDPKPRKRLDVGARKRIGRRVSSQERNWRKAVLERDNNKCQFPGCQVVSPHNDAHHKAKRSQRPDLKYSVENGITLCREHHQWTDLNHDAAVEMKLIDLTSYELAQKEKAT